MQLLALLFMTDSNNRSPFQMKQLNFCILRPLLLLLMLLTAVASRADQTYEFEVDGIYYNVLRGQDNCCEVTHNGIPSGEEFPDGKAYHGIVQVPETVILDTIEYRVTEINDHAFAMCLDLTYVTLPSSITVIDNNAFYGCNNLASVVLPQGLTSIGEFAFRDCYYLSPIDIPSTVTSIGNSAFSYCTSLQTIRIPEGITVLNNYMFHGCTNLTRIELPTSLSVIGQNAFSECTSLEHLQLPASVTSIGRSAFAECRQLEELILPPDVSIIENYAFRECESLERIDLHSHIRQVGDYAFSGCYSLMQVNMAESVEYIGDYSFAYCESLEDIVLPTSLQQIGIGAFTECVSLQSIAIPNGVERIPNECFAYCASLAEVRIPRTVISLGREAFGGCDELIDVYNYAVEPQEIDSLTFSTYGRLHVVEQHSDAFTSAPLWQDFEIIDDLPYVRINQIRLWVDELSCNITDVIQARADCYPSDATYPQVRWSSSNPQVVFIDPSTGQFVGARNGTAIITATAIDDSGLTASATITVGNGEYVDPEPLKPCDTPIIEFYDGQLQFSCSTVGARFHCSLSDPDALGDIVTDGSLPLQATLHIAVYATAEGYLPSAYAYATLHWLDRQNSEDAIPTILADKRPLFLTVRNGSIEIRGLYTDEEVAVYTASGQYLGTTVSHDGTAYIPLQGYKDTLVLLTISDQTIKVLVQ